MPHPTTSPPPSRDFSTSFILAGGALIIYLLTMSSYVGTEDPGEIATALDGMGVLHPTGYPLYTLIGSMFARLPLGDTVIWRLNFFSAVLTALAIFLFHRTFLLLLADRAVFNAKATHPAMMPPKGTSPERALKAGAIAATLILAFSALYWSQAVWLEVYALHLVFLAFVLNAFISALDSPQNSRAWLLFAYVLGLSFTHHMMTVLLAPAFLFLFFQVHGFGHAAWRRVATALPPFLLALTAYFYLPLRAAAAPLMNWGDPSTPRALWQHVRGAQYSHQMFSSWDVAGRKLLQFGSDLPGNFGYAPLLLVVLGLWALRRTPRFFWFTILIFCTAVLYAINYAFDDANFHLNAYVIVALWAGHGVAWVFKVTQGAIAGPVRVLTIAVALCPLVLNYAALNKNRDSLVNDYARNVLESMDSNAVYFSNEYERLVSPAFYLQNVEGFRKDIVVLDIIMLGNPWYYEHLEQRAPWLMELVRAEITLYRVEVTRFLEGGRDTLGHNRRLTALFHAIVEKSRSAGRPVYISEGINPSLVERYQHAPTGMVFRLLDMGDTTRVPLRIPDFRPLPHANKLTPVIKLDYAKSYAYQGAYLATQGDTLMAIRLLKGALALQPDFNDVTVFLSRLQPGKQ